MLLKNHLFSSQTQLAQAGVDNPVLEARLLAGHVLKLDRLELLMQDDRILTEDERLALNALIARRIAREPIGRILGTREFWGLSFSLNEATLEPRPDSETLIEAALKFLSPPPLSSCTKRSADAGSSLFLRSRSNKLDPASAAQPPMAATPPCGMTVNNRILDLGTGTGCLLLSLLHELPDATGIGIDISSRAIQQAQENATRLGFESRATFQTGHWLEGLTESFNLIISNPPYIKTADLETLAPEVKLFDPRAALDGGEDGYAPYRHLIPLLPSFLKPNGIALFEIGQGQAETVTNLMKQADFHNITPHNDLAGIPRAIMGQKKH